MKFLDAVLIGGLAVYGLAVLLIFLATVYFLAICLFFMLSDAYRWVVSRFKKESS